MSINFLYLRAFHAVATERSFTRAAQILHVSQSTLSAQVKALETRCGVRLLDRGQQVLPTQIGHEILQRCREVFRLQDEIESLVDHGRALDAGRLKIGADGPRHVMPVISHFIGLYPHVAVSLATGNARKVLRDLLNHETDVAIVAMAKARHSRLFMRPFSTYPLLAFVSRDHPWAGRRSVSLRDFDDERLIVREPTSMTRQMLLRALARAKARPAALIEIDNREASREAIALGIGVGVMSATEFPGYDDRTVPLPIKASELSITEYVACLHERSNIRAVREFFHIASQYEGLSGTRDRRS